MKSKFIAIAIALLMISLNSKAQQPDLIGTATNDRKGTVLSIDFASTPSVYGLQYDIKLPAGFDAKRANLSSCLSGLSSSFDGSSCIALNNDTIRVIIFSLSSEPVSTGNIGSILISRNGDRKDRSAMIQGRIENRAGIVFENVVIGGKAGVRIDPGLVDFSFASEYTQ